MDYFIEDDKCPYCNNKVTNAPVSDFFTYDSFHAELYCNKCGLIVKDNQLPTMEYLDYLAKHTDDSKKKKRKTKQKKENHFVNALNSFLDGIEHKKAIQRQKAKERRRKKKKQK